MKNLSKKSTAQNATSPKQIQHRLFTSFLKVKLDKSAQRALKGGSIIDQDIIEG